MSKEKAIKLLRDAHKHREYAEKLERVAKRQLHDADHDERVGLRDEHEVTAAEDHFGIKSLLSAHKRKDEKPVKVFTDEDHKKGRKNAIASALHRAAADIHREAVDKHRNHPDRFNMSPAKSRAFAKSWDKHSEGHYQHARAGNAHADTAYELLGKGGKHTYDATHKAIKNFSKQNGHKATLHAVNRAIRGLGKVSTEF